VPLRLSVFVLSFIFALRGMVSLQKRELRGYNGKNLPEQGVQRVNIFGIGGAELVLIFVIMLIVAGPKRMIRWAYVMGTYVGKLRRMWEEVVDMMQKEADDAGLDIKIPKELPTKAGITKLVADAVKPYADEIKKPIEEIKAPLRDTMTEANALMKETQDKPKNAESLNATKDESFGSWGQQEEGKADNGTGRA
jgi:Sec-independent protein translocase protein TatA